MIQEALIIFACANNTGCTPSLSAYTQYNPETVRQYEQLYGKLYKAAPFIVVQYFLPLASILNSKTVTLKISNSFITEVNSENILIKYTIEY